MQARSDVALAPRDVPPAEGPAKPHGSGSAPLQGLFLPTLLGPEVSLHAPAFAPPALRPPFAAQVALVPPPQGQAAGSCLEHRRRVFARSVVRRQGCSLARALSAPSRRCHSLLLLLLVPPLLLLLLLPRSEGAKDLRRALVHLAPQVRRLEAVRTLTRGRGANTGHSVYTKKYMHATVHAHANTPAHTHPQTDRQKQIGLSEGQKYIQRNASGKHTRKASRARQWNNVSETREELYLQTSEEMPNAVRPESDCEQAPGIPSCT